MGAKKHCFVVLTSIAAFFISVAVSSAYRNIGEAVDAYCPSMPFSGDCSLCHLADRSLSTPAKTQAANGNYAWFCPPDTGPTCTDADNDNYFMEGGNCGQQDCDDSNAAVYPGATENCTDLIDNDCDGLVDRQDPDAVGCPPLCTDNDADGYSPDGGNCGPLDCDDTDGNINPAANEICNDGVDNNCNGMIDENCGTVCTNLDGDNYFQEGGACGQVDCDDTDNTVYPGAVENCTDQVDNDCDGLVDNQDPDAVNCPTSCTDADADTYFMEGGNCGQMDCDDADASVNPGAAEVCGDNVDNDCDGSIDEGCNPTCPDADNDGFADAVCGGTDCDDADGLINPGMAETCGNGVDENCNGMTDDTCIDCPAGGVLTIKKASFDMEDKELEVKGRSHVGTTITLVDADTGNIIAESVNVDGGKWKVEIKDMDPAMAPLKIQAINTDGCTSEKDVLRKGIHENDENDGGHDEHDGNDNDNERDENDNDDEHDDDNDEGQNRRGRR